MDLAEQAEIRVRSDYAFGEAGSAPEIKSGETLRFIVELKQLQLRWEFASIKRTSIHQLH